MPPSIQNSETSRRRKLVAFYNDCAVKDQRFFYRRKRLLPRNLNCSYTRRDCDLVVPVFNYLILRNSSSMSLKVIKLVESKVINGAKVKAFLVSYDWNPSTVCRFNIYIYLVVLLICLAFLLILMIIGRLDNEKPIRNWRDFPSAINQLTTCEVYLWTCKKAPGNFILTILQCRCLKLESNDGAWILT